MTVPVQNDDGSTTSYTEAQEVSSNTFALENVTLRAGSGEKSWSIDQGSDIFAARASRITGNILVANGLEIREGTGNWVIPQRVRGFVSSGEVSDNVISFSGLRGIKASTGGIHAYLAETASGNTLALSGAGLL